MSPPRGEAALVMFDLDGTLIETAAEVQEAVNDTLVRHGLRAVREAQVRRWIGQGTRSLLARAVASASGTTAAAVRASGAFTAIADEFSGHYRRRCGTRSTLYPHVREVLAELRQRGIRVAVVTSKERDFSTMLLERHSLRHLFDAIVSGDCVRARRPRPDGLLVCMAELGVPGNRALFVGNSAIDVAAARAAGVSAWGVTHGRNPGRPLAEAAPERLMSDLRPLLSLWRPRGFR